MKFTVYDNVSGRVLRMGSCPDEQVSSQAQSGETAVEGHFAPLDYRFDAGVAVPLPSLPSRFHRYDYSAQKWVLDSNAAWASVRRRRVDLLTASDWMCIRAQDGGPPLPIAWADYRQALRDITMQNDPLNIAWPTPPA